jgi:hypothetical protein
MEHRRAWIPFQVSNVAIELFPTPPHHRPEVILVGDLTGAGPIGVGETCDRFHQRVEQIDVSTALQRLENHGAGLLRLEVTTVHQFFQRLGVQRRNLVLSCDQPGTQHIQITAGARGISQPPELPSERCGRWPIEHVENIDEGAKVGPEPSDRHPELVQVFLIAAEADAGVMEQQLIERTGHGMPDGLMDGWLRRQRWDDHVGWAQLVGAEHPHQLRHLRPPPTPGAAQCRHHRSSGPLGSEPVELLDLDLVELQHWTVGAGAADVVDRDFDQPGTIACRQALGNPGGDQRCDDSRCPAAQLGGQEPQQRSGHVRFRAVDVDLTSRKVV